MSQAVVLDLDLAVAEVDVVGAETASHSEIDEQFTTAVETEVQSQVEQIQKQFDIQQAELAKTKDALIHAISQIEQLQTQMIEEVKHEAVELALAIARKITAQEIEAQRVEIDPIIIGALQQLPTRGAVKIHLNPSDLKRSGFAEEAQNAHARDLKFIADPEISPGGCLVESVEGSVETSIDSSLKKIGEALRQPEEE